MYSNSLKTKSKYIIFLLWITADLHPETFCGIGWVYFYHCFPHVFLLDVQLLVFKEGANSVSHPAVVPRQDASRPLRASKSRNSPANWPVACARTATVQVRSGCREKDSVG